MLAFDTRADLAGLARFHTEAAPVLELASEELFEAAPEVSGWSAGHHLFHVLLANELAFRNVTLIARAAAEPERASKWVQAAGEPSLLGYLVQAWGWIPRGVGQSPRAVTPPPRPDIEIVRDTLRSCVESIAALEPRLDELCCTPGGVPHQDLGWLGIPGWLRFARVHGWHHLTIVREVLGAGAGAR